MLQPETEAAEEAVELAAQSAAAAAAERRAVSPAVVVIFCLSPDPVVPSVHAPACSQCMQASLCQQHRATLACLMEVGNDAGADRCV